MPLVLRKLLCQPVFLLASVAFLASWVIQPGDVGSGDTLRRLQTTHWFWTSAPPLAPGPGTTLERGGLIGRDGRAYAWYGMGQSLLMLPSDVLGTLVAGHASRSSGTVAEQLQQRRDAIRRLIVSYLTSTLVCVLSISVCFRFLRRLEFTVKQAIAGALALLFATTFLHYTQVMFENNFILLLTITGFCFQYDWVRTGSRRALIAGSAALGANLLTRLTTALDIIAAGTFVVALLFVTRTQAAGFAHRVKEYISLAGLCYAVFFSIDRAYQYYRFGSISNTYLQVLATQAKLAHPGLPSNWPFSGAFSEGFRGAFLSPQKSIFLFDPLLLLSLALAIVLWRRLEPPIAAYLSAVGALLFVYISFYATYYDWSGDYAWGDRYVATAAQLLAFMSVPLLLRCRRDLGTLLRWFGVAIVTVAAIVQVGSVLLWHHVEIFQGLVIGPRAVVVLRWENVIAAITGKAAAWGLSNGYLQMEPVRSSFPYFFPFLAYRSGHVSHFQAAVLFGQWAFCLALLSALLAIIAVKARSGGFETSSIDEVAPWRRVAARQTR